MTMGLSSRGSWLPESSRIDLLICGSLFLLSLAIRTTALSAMGVYPDELNYWGRGITILGSSWAWPRNYMLDQPPLFSYVLAVVISLGGGSLDTLRWVSALAGAGTVVVVYALAKSMFNRGAGIFAGILVATDGLAIEYSRLIYIESTAILLITVTVYLFWEAFMVRRRAWIAAIAGVFLGLSFDTKYIALVIPIGLFVFAVVYRKKIGNPFPWQSLAAFALAALLTIAPVLFDLYANQRNPFAWLLEQRFGAQGLSSGVGASSIGAASLGLALTSVAALFSHVSSLNPFEVFPLYGLSLDAWSALIVSVTALTAAFFLYRRNPREGYLLLFFVGFLLFAALYPAKRYYFFLYCFPPFSVMVGGAFAGALRRVTVPTKLLDRRTAITIAAVAMLALTTSSAALNVATVPATYVNGFGDWDEMPQIMNYVQHNLQQNTTIATNISVPLYYGTTLGFSAPFAPLQVPVYYYQLQPAQQVGDTPIKPGYPVVWVLSADLVQNLRPNFIVISNNDYKSTSLSFRETISNLYYQPLSTRLVLLFQLQS